MSDSNKTSTNKQKLGKNIRAYRKFRGMTQEELAAEIGVASSTIAMYETGRREPDMDTIEALADIFNCRKADLIPEQRPLKLSVAGAIPAEERLKMISDAVASVVVASEMDTQEDVNKAKNIRAMIRGMLSLSVEKQKKLLDMACVMFPEVFTEES